MSTVNENGSFGVNPIVSREGFTIDPTTGLPYTDNLYSKDVRPIVNHVPINPDTGRPYTEQEIDALPLSGRMNAMDFSSPSEQVSTVVDDYTELIVDESGEIIGEEQVYRTVYTHSAPKSGVLRYSVGRNRAYSADDKVIKREEAVQKYSEQMASWRLKMDAYHTAVQDWLDIGGKHSGVKRPKRPTGKPQNPLNKSTPEKKAVIPVFFDGFQTISTAMTEGYGCTPEQCANVQAAIESIVQQQMDLNKRTREQVLHDTGRPYTIHWSELSGSGEGYTLYRCAVPIGFFHVMMEALCKCTPRMDLTMQDGHCTGVQHTPEQECYLQWCENVHRLYVHRRIDSNESNSQGFDGKTLYRGKREQTYLIRDNRATRGRLYSACDREDIVNRSFIIAFLPDLCTLVSVTDEGHGYVQCPDVQSVMEPGEKQFELVSMRTGRVQIRTLSGWRITYTDVQTGRLYSVFTQSEVSAKRLNSYTGIVACTDEDCTSGQFGMNTTELVSRTVQSFSPSFPYAGIVKYVVRRLFEMLYKRPTTKSDIVWQAQYLRNSFGMDNGIPLYSIYKSNEHLFSDVEADIIEVELTPVQVLSDMYKSTRPDERRAEMFRNLRYIKNGTLVHCGQKMYKRMAEQLYRKMKRMVESTDV